MNTDLASAVERYVVAAIIHGDATEEGDYKRGNPAHDKVLLALRQIRAAGEEGTQALLGLLKHENASVRGWAATHLLKVAEKPAIKVLCVGPAFVARATWHRRGASIVTGQVKTGH